MIWRRRTKHCKRKYREQKYDQDADHEGGREGTQIRRNEVGNIIRVTDDRLSNLEQNYGKLFTDVAATKNSMNKAHMQLDTFSNEIEKLTRDDSSQD